MRKQLWAALAVLIAIVGTVGAASAMRGHMFGSAGPQDTHMQGIQSAVAANDYDAYKTAVTAAYTEQVSQEHFTTLVSEYTTHQRADAAIKAGNYADWQAAVEKLQGNSTHVPSQEEFNRMVAMYQKRSSGNWTDFPHPPMGRE